MRPPGGSGSWQLLRHKNNNQLYVHKKIKKIKINKIKTFKKREEDAGCIKEVDMCFARRNKHTLGFLVVITLAPGSAQTERKRERERERERDRQTASQPARHSQPARQTDRDRRNRHRQTDRHRERH